MGLEANYMYVPELSHLPLVSGGKTGTSSESTFPRWMFDIIPTVIAVKATTACNTTSITTGFVMNRINVSSASVLRLITIKH